MEINMNAETKDKQKIVLRASNEIFLNSQCIFIQYHDIIKSPWFTALRLVRLTDALNDIFFLNEIDPSDVLSQFEWYINRTDRNIFDCFAHNININITPEWRFNLLKNLTQIVADDYIKNTIKLSTYDVLKTLFTNTKLFDSAIIWDEMGIDSIREDCLDIFPVMRNNKSIKFDNRPFNELIKEIPEDTTYLISDIELINNIKDSNHLDFSSIVLADYRYNKNPDGSLKINIKKLQEEHHVFKFAEFSTLGTGMNHKVENNDK